jgi:FkbM family methyltransferase
MPEKIIFDFGCNNGDDIPYYLAKADKVVAVEANPALAALVEQRFAAEIREGRVVVESCALTVDEAAPAVPFYVHKTNHVQSQFVEPGPDEMALFERVDVRSENVAKLIERNGAPYYVKIDIEHYDHLILRSIFEAGIFPPYISAESHSIEVLALLIGLGGYGAFKLVEGRTVPEKYRNATISTAQGKVTYSFPPHSAGPFGEDIAGAWMTMNNFFTVLAATGLGWRDIHASRVDVPDPHYVAPVPQFRPLARARSIARRLRSLTGWPRAGDHLALGGADQQTPA